MDRGFMRYSTRKQKLIMSKRPRRNNSAAFKTKIALVEFIGDKILIKLSEHFVVYAKQVTQWKAWLL